MNPFKSYSQHGEDYVIFSYFKKRAQGVIIDIGAFDGVHISNSYVLYNMGWKTIAIEANPILFNFLGSNRPKGINIPKAIVGKSTQTEVVFQTEKSGLYSGIKPNTEYFETEGSQEIRVPACTINQVVEEFCANTHIDCISIDVEGTEEEILSSFNFERYKPTMLIIEANDQAAEDRLIQLMKPFNYTLGTKIGVNLFFLYKPSILNIIRLNAIRIDCESVKTSNPILPLSSAVPFKPEHQRIHLKRMLHYIKNALL